MPEDPREGERTEADKSELAPLDSEISVLGNFCQICTPRSTMLGQSSCRFLPTILPVDPNFGVHIASVMVEKEVTGRQFPNTRSHTDVSRQLSPNPNRAAHNT